MFRKTGNCADGHPCLPRSFVTRFACCTSVCGVRRYDVTAIPLLCCTPVCGVRRYDVTAIPQTKHPHLKDYLIENIDLFDWELTDADMATLDGLKSPPVAGDPDGSSGDCKVV